MPNDKRTPTTGEHAAEPNSVRELTEIELDGVAAGSSRISLLAPVNHLVAQGSSDSQPESTPKPPPPRPRPRPR